jgi:hypothetical protein
MDLVLGEEGFGLLVIYAGVNDHVFTLLPVDGGGNSVLVTSLKSIDDTDDFVLSQM